MPAPIVANVTYTSGDNQFGEGDEEIYTATPASQILMPLNLKNEFLWRMGVIYGFYTKDQFTALFGNQKEKEIMPYPVFPIPYNQWLNYTNNLWITNGSGDITGVIGNNVVNALFQYITNSPLNATLVDLVSTTGSYQVTHGITFFMVKHPQM